MSKFVYVVSINYDSFNSFDEIHLFYEKQDAINFLENDGYSHKFDDEYYMLHGHTTRHATIRLYEVQGEAHGNSNTDNAN